MQPITITINAATVEAANAIRDFVSRTKNGLSEVKEIGHATEGVFAANKMAIMEMGHSARAMVDGTVAGMDPIRLLAMEAPRLLQAGSMMTEELKTKLLGYLPVVGAVAAAVGAGFVAWELFTADERKAAEEAQKLAEALDKIPAILEKIHALGKAGLMSEAAQKEFADYLGKNPRKKLYVTSSGDLSENPQEMQDVQVPGGEKGVWKTAKRLVDLPQATPDQVNEWELKQMPQASENEVKAKNKLADLTKRASLDLLDGLEKEKAEIHERYQKEREEVELALEQSRDLMSQKDQMATTEMIQQSHLAEARAIAAAQLRHDQESARQAAAALAKSREEAAQAVKQKLDEVEAAISIRAGQEGVVRGQYAEREYQERYDALAAAYEAGGLAEGEYTQKLAAAWKERVQGVHEYQAEIQKTRALQEEIARGDLQAKIKNVQGDQFSTQSEKDSQLTTLYSQLEALNAQRIEELQLIHAQTTDVAAQLEAEKQITELKHQQADIGDKMYEAQKSQNPAVAFGTMFANLRDQAEINFSTLATTFQNVFNTAVQSISHGITGLIEGTMTWGQALRSIANSILNEVISAIVQMGVRWLLTQAIMAIGGKAIAASAAAASAPIAAMQSAIWTPPAVLATIATLGSAAIAAPGFIGAANAMTMLTSSFATGGYTGDGGVFEPAGVVHKGEYVFSQAAVNRIGVPVLDAMHNNAAGSGAAGAAGAVVSNKTNLAVYGFTDPNQMMEHFHKSDAHEAYVVDVMARNAHKISR